MNGKKEQRILCRTLAKELTPEELGIVGGSVDDGAATIEPIDQGPPLSTLVATLPSYREDQ